MSVATIDRASNERGFALVEYKEYIDRFIKYLEENDKSTGTIGVYKRSANRFIRFLAGEDLKDVTTNDIKRFKLHLRQEGLGVKSINLYLVGVKQFIDFVNEYFKISVVAKITQEKVQRQYSLKDDELMMDEDFQEILGVVTSEGDIRAQAIFETMYFSGMRVSEMLQLRVDHVGLSVIDDIKGKGGKYRDIFISKKLQRTLQRYLKERKKNRNAKGCAQLFIGQRGPINRQTVHNLLKHYADLAGVQRSKAHAHNLRHLFGIRCAEKGLRIEEIAKFMGHTSTDITKLYLEKPQSHYVSKIDEL